MTCSPYIDPGNLGHILVCTTGSLPTGGELYAGRVVYNLTTGCFHYYDGTNWWQLNDEIICTSATRPSGAALHDGLRIFETDTKESLVYYSAAAVWRKPWMEPWGIIGYSQITANTSSVSAVTDIGVSVAWTAVANRRHKTTLNIGIFGTVAADQLLATIADGSNTQLARQVFTVVANNTGGHVSLEYISTPSAGSVTHKGRHQRLSGTGTSTMTAGATYPGFILVEDIGPSSSTPA